MSYQSKFLVIRQDDNGVKYVEADKLTQHEAELLVERLSARGHKQMFFSRSWTTEAQRGEILQ